MQKHNDLPGSPAWHARRARCFNAGDASAMLGCHPSGKTRTQLLHELHTGIEPEFSDYVQEKVINPGHRIEELWRPIAEEIIGEDLQVLAGTLDVGLSRPLGASLDGITFMEDTLGECKSANEALRAALPHEGRDSHERNDARKLPKGYRVQMEQQQLVTGATRTLFSACRFNEDGTVAEERHCWYTSDPELRREIMAGWMQFDVDLAAYVPPAASTVEKIVAEPVEALPAVSVVVEGALVVRDNFAAFQQRLTHFLEHRLIREPKTDQDFANLDAQIKEMKSAEEALTRAEAQMLAQIQSVDQAKKTKDMLVKLVRDNRLMAEKLLASEKERRKGEIVAGGVKALADHIAGLNARLGKPYMPTVPADFGGCIRGLKSLASMEDKVATELARAKAAGNEICASIALNLQALAGVADKAFLFADERTLVLKAPDDCKAAIAARLAEHDRKEAARLEAERARIRAEEEERAAAKLRAQQAERAAEERRQREAAAEAERQADLQRRREEANAAGAAAMESIDAARASDDFPPLLLDEMESAASGLIADLAIHHAAETAKPANVVPMPTKAPAPAGAMLKLGDINRLIGRGSYDASDLADLGFPHVATEKSAKLWHAHDFPRIVGALIAHLQAVQMKEAA